MLKPVSKKSSKDINKLAAFIVDAISSQKESLTTRIKGKNSSTIVPERISGLKDDRARAEKNAEKTRGIIALKAAMERRSK